MDGTATNAFAALRPPGHHAERERAMGFSSSTTSPSLRDTLKSDTVESASSSSIGMFIMGMDSSMPSKMIPASCSSAPINSHFTPVLAGKSNAAQAQD